ncbi:MAG: DUF1566 domain-containing protein [Patescibacteria group bacterium]|nr:DUF1566 domain-containing protein [Patescibacteria group bacterium]
MRKNFKPLLIGVLVIGAAVAGVYYVIAGTVTDSYDNDDKIAAAWNISTSTAGEIKLANRECDVFDWFCSASTTCVNYLGDGDYIIVAQADAPTTKQWKTANTACDKPECGADGGENWDNLVADNTIDFSDYPARDYCQSIGGRLPTIDELSCIYTYRATFGDNFGTGYHWSSTETADAYARGVYFSDGNVNNDNKTNANAVRCVRGW